MNRKLTYILLSMAGLLTLASPTCEEVSPERRIEDRLEALQLVREDLVAPALTRRNLEAFESRAMEKLGDYADLLGMVSDTGLALSFHDLARTNLEELFLEEQVPEIPFPADLSTEVFASMAFRIDSVTVEQPLARVDGESYRGRLRFRVRVFGIHPADSTLLFTSDGQMGMALNKRTKEFGDKRLQVWEVLLTSQTP